MTTSATTLVLNAIREGLLLVLLLSAPPLIASVVIGFLVGLFQAATQIQDQTLAVRSQAGGRHGRPGGDGAGAGVVAGALHAGDVAGCPFRGFAARAALIAMPPGLLGVVVATALGGARVLPVIWMVAPLGGPRLPATVRVGFALLLALVASPALVASAGLGALAELSVSALHAAARARDS